AELGQLELLKKNRPAARAAFERAVATNPVQLDAIAGLVSMDLQEKRVDAARSRLDAAITGAPNNSPLLMIAAQTHASLGDAAAAERLARQALTIDPDNTSAFTLLGNLFITQRRLDEATAQFAELVKRQPNSIAGHTSLGILYEMQNNTA